MVGKAAVAATAASQGDGSPAARFFSSARVRLVGFGARRFACVVLLACAPLGGCAAPARRPPPLGRHIAKANACTEEVYDHPSPDFSLSDHLIVADSLGHYEAGELADGVALAPSFSQQFERVLEAHARFRAARPAGLDRMLLFVNGGLAGLAYNIERARQQVPCMMRDGYFPVFLIWETGGSDAYWEQVSRIRSERESDSFRWDTPFFFLGDLGEGFVRAPATYLTQFRRFLDATLTYIGSTFSGKQVVESNVLNLQYDGPEDTPQDLVSGGVKYGVTSPAKIVTIPFTVSFGRTAWENIERRADATIRQSTEFDAKTRDLAALQRYPKGTGTFSRFMAELDRCVARDASCLEKDGGASLAGLEITLISHSVGCQIVEDLVSLYDNLPYRNVVHMGSGSSIRHFIETLQPVLERRPSIRFYNLSLHPSADAREVSVFGLIPSGSMLEWIDDMFADPATPLDRTMGKWLNDSAAEHVFAPELRDRMVFRVFGFRPPDPAIGDPGDPVTHSDFVETRMEYWLPDFWSLSPLE